MSEKIGSVVLDLLDKYPHLSQAAVQARVCSILGVAPEKVSDVYKEVKEYLRKNVGTLFGAEQHQSDPDYNYRERRFWRLPITQRQLVLRYEKRYGKQVETASIGRNEAAQLLG